MIGKIMYLCRKYRDEIIFGKLLENLLDMKKPHRKNRWFSFCGEDEIRTRGASYLARRFSKPVV